MASRTTVLYCHQPLLVHWITVLIRTNEMMENGLPSLEQKEMWRAESLVDVKPNSPNVFTVLEIYPSPPAFETAITPETFGHGTAEADADWRA